jgi:hypothetical protein
LIDVRERILGFLSLFIYIFVENLFMKKSLLLFIISLISVYVHSQKAMNNKIIIDQKNAYSIVNMEGKIVLEIRALDKAYDQVILKLLPINNNEKDINISWDIKDGFFYTIQIAEYSSVEDIHFIKKIKIDELSTDLNYNYTPIELENFSNSISNMPFILLHKSSLLNTILSADISVSDKIYFTAKLKDKTIIYSDQFSDNWEQLEISSTDFKSVVFLKDHYFIDNNFIYTNLDCDNCNQKKTNIENKNPFIFLINKNDSTIKKVENMMENNSDMKLQDFFIKNSSDFDFN